MILDSTTKNKLLLTIAIPTFNRSEFLRRNLERLLKEVRTVAIEVDIVISDNASTDGTSTVVMDSINAGLRVRFFRNERNLGFANNYKKCIELALGDHVLVIGDDDQLCCGALTYIISQIIATRCDVMCIRSFGFDYNGDQEKPMSTPDDKVFDNANEFLSAIGPLSTQISSCIFRKNLVSDIPDFSESNDLLVNLHTLIRATLAGKRYVFIRRFLIACKRNNSNGYDWFHIFVTCFFVIYRAYRNFGISDGLISSLENKLLKGFYPRYLFSESLSRPISRNIAKVFFGSFKRKIFFWLFCAPLIYLPRPVNQLIGLILVPAGRLLDGGGRRMLAFAFSRVRILGKKTSFGGG